MSAAVTLRAARTAGIQIRVDGADLALEAHTAPPPDLLDRLARYKPEIVALLRQDRDGWSAEDWLAYFDERAGIAEFDGGLPRLEAEALAFESCVVEWMNRTFERSPPGICLACGGKDSAHDVLLPHGTEPAGHAWFHSRCWPQWFAKQRISAIEALRAIGLADRS